MNIVLNYARQAHLKNFILCCRITDTFMFLLTFFELPATVINVTVDARPVKEMVAQC